MELRPQASAGFAPTNGASQVSVLRTAAVIAAVAASAVAQLQFAELGKRALPPDRDDTRSTVLGDVDGDGDLDLVVGNGVSSNGQSRLYLNNGTGTFTDATASRMPVDSDNTTSLALGDVDRDGDLDLVVGNGVSSNGQNRLYLNDGTGTFTDATASRMPADGDNTTSLALGDVDGDGDLDLVVGNNGQSRLYLNNGAGMFMDATASRMPVGTYATLSLALGDVDRDGDLDLVAGNHGQQSRLYLNDGTGTFTDATVPRLPAANHGTRSLALGDVDGDGDLDLVVGNHGQQSRLYSNDGAGTFTDATAPRLPVANDYTTSLALGDVDRDGDLDLAVGNDGQNRLYLNNGTATFTDATASRMAVRSESTFALALADVDLDGDLDLIAGNNGPNRLYLNNGTATFIDATASRMPVGSYYTLSLAFGDVDGDSDLDLVVGNNLRQNRLYLNNGTGTFTDVTASRMPFGDYSTRSHAFGDVDGDGDLDLVVGNHGQASRLYLNNGAGTFTDANMPFGAYETNALALGDVDGDGDLDLVAGNGDSNHRQSRLYLNNGTGTFTDATVSRMPVGTFNTTSLALGDVDRDGDLDLVVGNFAQLSRLYLNDGTGRFNDATGSRMPFGSHNTSSLALGDVDRDGDLDLVVGNSYQQNRIYLNDGTGTFTDATGARMPIIDDGTNALALGDVDLDGDLDLVVGNGLQQNRLHLNNGTGTFTDATGSRMPLGTFVTAAVAFGDVDGDGDLDLVDGNNGQQSRLYLNLLRQLDAPYVLHVGRLYQLDVYSRYGPATLTENAFPFLSTGTANIPFPPLGTIGIDLNQVIALPPFVVAQPAGIGSLTILIPNVPAFAGIAIYTQALLQQHPVQVRLTNVAGDVALH